MYNLVNIIGKSIQNIWSVKSCIYISERGAWGIILVDYRALKHKWAKTLSRWVWGASWPALQPSTLHALFRAAGFILPSALIKYVFWFLHGLPSYLFTKRKAHVPTWQMQSCWQCATSLTQGGRFFINQQTSWPVCFWKSSKHVPEPKSKGRIFIILG